MLAVYLYAGRSPHILCLPHELGSIPPVNLISNMRTFHGLGTAQKLFFCLFTCYIPTISTMFIEKFPLLHYKHKHKQWWWLETQLVRIVSCLINNNNDPHFSNSRTVSLYDDMNLVLVSENLKNTNMLQRKGLVITRYPGLEVCPRLAPPPPPPPRLPLC